MPISNNFKQPHLMVYPNGLTPDENVDMVEQKLLKVVPAEFKVGVQHGLILHGRYTCNAHMPRCGSCIIKDKTE